MSGPVQAKPANDVFINLALGALVAAVGFAGLLRLAGSITASLTGLPEPSGGFTSGVGVLARPADPGAPLGADGPSAKPSPAPSRPKTAEPGSTKLRHESTCRSFEHPLFGAPDRNRTCDLWYRKPTLYPLSYGGVPIEGITA